MTDQSLEELKASAAESVSHDEGLRARVRELTLRALRERALDAGEIRRVARAIGEGVSLGLERRTGDIKGALAEAMAGLDEALAKAAEASQLALRQLVSQGRDFGEHELKQSLEQLKQLEGNFLDALGGIADAGSARIKQELREFVTHARRAGTDTGAVVAATVEEFSNRVQATLETGKASASHAARDVGARLAEAASGFFAALADALQEKSKK